MGDGKDGSKGHTIADKKKWDQKLIQFPEKIEGPIYS